MIKIETNAGAVALALVGAAKQLPYAMARVATITAQACQGAIREHLGDTLTIRNSWVAKGIRITPATKQTLTAEVGSRDRFMALQAEGGERQGKGSGAVAVPVAARADKSKITRPSRWPGKILDGRGYKAKLASGAIGVFKRTGKGKNSKTVLFYVLARKVEVKADWPFEAVVRAAAAEAMPSAMLRAIADVFAIKA